MHASRQLRLGGPHRLTVDDEVPGPVAPGHARIRVQAAGVCGSDVHGFAGLNDRRPPGVVMGHEVGGVVVAVGPGVGTVAPGDHVVVNPVVVCRRCRACGRGRENLCEHRRLYGCTVDLAGGFADHMDVRAQNLVPFSGSAPREWASLVEPLAVGVHAVERTRHIDAGRAIIVGAGPIGLACALAARRLGIEVMLSEPVPERRAVAERLGLEARPPAHAGDGGGADLVFECVGLERTVTAALALAAIGGTVVCVGVADPTLAIPSVPLVVEERSLVGSSAYTPPDFAATAEWVADGHEDLGALITDRRTIGELPATFDALAGGMVPAGKTIMVAS